MSYTARPEKKNSSAGKKAKEKKTRRAEMTREERTVVISTYLMFIFFSLMMIPASIIFGWDHFPLAVISVQSAVAAAAMFYKKVRMNICGFVLTGFCIMDMWIYSLYSGSFYDVLVVSAAFTVLVAFYNSFIMIFMMMGSLLILMVYSILFAKNVPLSDGAALLRLSASMIFALSVQSMLAGYIGVKKKSDADMKKTIEQAHAAERAKADFLANMSHEIRTPMNAIIGMCELILRDEKNLSESAVENCFGIKSSGRSLLAIINDILDFSKIESGNMVLSSESYNISSVVSDVINMASSSANSRELEIIADIDPNIPSGLIGDELRIRQIITNLMSNAVKFTQKGTVILRVTKRDTDYGINLKVAVQDTGIGISQEDIEKLFVSFQQVDTKKNRSVEGTGLGLAISKRFVRMMGGFINVRSEYGKGSEFSFVIPQKIHVKAPIVSIPDIGRLKCACYVRFDKFTDRVSAYGYRLMIKNAAAGLNSDVMMFDDLPTLKQAAETVSFTHIFTAKEEYLEDRQFFEDMSENTEVVLIQKRTDTVNAGSRIKIIYKPFFVNSIAAVLSKDRRVGEAVKYSGKTGDFTAPGIKVLIVDDNEVNLRVSAGLMKPYGMQISTALSGREAISKLSGKDFHIVFMDHMMPEMDGVETTKMIRSDPDRYFADLPIIALTANAVGSARDMFIRSGFNDYLPKPMEVTALDRVLRKYIPPSMIIKKNGRAETAQKAPRTEEQPVNKWFSPDEGLKYAGNDNEAYIDILKVYRKNGLLKIDELQRLYASGNWKNYTIEVHALKSSSRSIGAVRLSDDALALENAGKSGDYGVIRRGHADLIKGYRIVLASVDSYIAAHEGRSEKSGVLAEINEENLSRRLGELISALDDFDDDKALGIIKELEGYSCRGMPLSVVLKEVRSLTEDYEYSRAAQTAAALSVYKR